MQPRTVLLGSEDYGEKLLPVAVRHTSQEEVGPVNKGSGNGWILLNHHITNFGEKF